MILTTLESAFRECVARMGPAPSSWQWGRIHHGYFPHAITPLRGREGESFDVGPLPKGGSDSTPMNASYRLDDFRVVSGASIRMVIDVGHWDRSVCINAPGQSGDPRSPHYADLAAKWAAGEYVPLLYSESAIDGAAELRIELMPAMDPGATDHD